VPVPYSVIATLPDEPTRDEYVAWLLDGHLAGVLRGGVFPTPESFLAYLADYAPPPRGDGLARFGACVMFAGRVGAVLVGPGADA